MGSLQNKIIIWEETWSNFQTTSLENEFEANTTQITLRKKNIDKVVSRQRQKNLRLDQQKSLLFY